MPNITCNQAVQADIQSIWEVLLDKVENPKRYMAYVQETRFLEDTPDYVVREIKTENMTVVEKITIDERQGEVKFQLVEHPLFSGEVTHAVIPPARDLQDGLPVVSIHMNWQPKNDEARMVESQAREEIQESLEEATQYIKRMAEQLERQKKSNQAV